MTCSVMYVFLLHSAVEESTLSFFSSSLTLPMNDLASAGVACCFCAGAACGADAQAQRASAR